MKTLLSALLLLPILACGSSSSEPSSSFWNENGDVRGFEGRFLAPLWSLEEIVRDSHAVVEVRVESISGVELPAPIPDSIKAENPDDQWKVDRDRSTESPPLKTTYSTTVLSWIRGEGESSLLVRGIGGLMSDGTAYFPDGSFLLEPGRNYVLVLYEDDDGVYEYGFARMSFDTSRGVRVLNHPWTRDLEHFEDMSVNAFVEHVRGLTNADATSAR